MTSSSDPPAASSTVSMLLKVCSVCSTRSSLTTLPVFGSKPPWPDRKIHSPTVSPGEYGPAGTETLSELMGTFMSQGLLEVVVRRPRTPGEGAWRARRPLNVAPFAGARRCSVDPGWVYEDTVAAVWAIGPDGD